MVHTIIPATRTGYPRLDSEMVASGTSITYMKEMINIWSRILIAIITYSQRNADLTLCISRCTSPARLQLPNSAGRSDTHRKYTSNTCVLSFAIEHRRTWRFFRVNHTPAVESCSKPLHPLSLLLFSSSRTVVKTLKVLTAAGQHRTTILLIRCSTRQCVIILNSFWKVHVK